MVLVYHKCGTTAQHGSCGPLQVFPEILHKNISLVDILSVVVDRMQRNFEPMKR
jgi:hypothetical protein